MARRHVRPLTSGLTHRWTFQGTRANLSGQTVDEVGAVNGTITRATDGNWVKIMVVTDFHLDNVDSATQFRTEAVARAGIVGQKAADVGADLILVLGDSVEDPDRIPASAPNDDLAEVHAALTDPGVSAAYVFGNHDCWTDENNRRKDDFLTIVGGANPAGADVEDGYQLVDVGAGLRLLILDSCFGELGGGGVLVSYDAGGYQTDPGGTGYTTADENNWIPEAAADNYTDQRTWLQGALTQADTDSRRVLICSHFPLKTTAISTPIQNRANIITDLEGDANDVTIACLAAHGHISEFTEANGISYITFDAAVENPASSFSYGLLTVNDLTGEWGLTAYGHQQPYSSSPAYISKYGLTVDGATSSIYVDMTSDVIVTSNDKAPAEQFSVATWIIIDGPANDRRVVATTTPQFTADLTVEGVALGAGQITATVLATDPGAETASAQEGVASSQDVWHHVVMTYNNGPIKLYVDGALEDTATIGAGKTLRAATGYHIATFRDANARFFDGEINRVEVYDHELSLLEVQALFSQGGRTGVLIA